MFASCVSLPTRAQVGNTELHEGAVVISKPSVSIYLRCAV
uniref:Uncharacterized protein n=1 Tax=Anguilla anguilla TaxID=7936 RepID=A0A0E9S8W4_ANGAN